MADEEDTTPETPSVQELTELALSELEIQLDVGDVTTRLDIARFVLSHRHTACEALFEGALAVVGEALQHEEDEVRAEAAKLVFDELANEDDDDEEDDDDDDDEE